MFGANDQKDTVNDLTEWFNHESFIITLSHKSTQIQGINDKEEKTPICSYSLDEVNTTMALNVFQSLVCCVHKKYYTQFSNADFKQSLKNPS